MSERVVSGRTDGLITLAAADALWVRLTAAGGAPTASGAFTGFPAHAPMGYVLLGGQVVATVRAGDGRWYVPEGEVRRAAAELNAVGIDRLDLVRIGPFRGAPRQDGGTRTPLRWRSRIMGGLQEPDGGQRAVRRVAGRADHLAGIDWRRILVEQTRDGTRRTWFLPRAVVRLLDTAEHAEAQWLRAARTRRAGTAVSGPSVTGPPVVEPPVSGPSVSEPPAGPQQAPGPGSRRTAGPEGPTAPLRPYGKELEGRLYSVLSRKSGIAGKVAGWACAVCRTAPATVLDHCHEHGYVRAPVCQSCNTQERPDHLYSNDIRVAGRYTRLFSTDTDDWLRHWHRCPGCRTRATLPLPHLAAWTAHTACRSLRPAHRAPGGRKPCGTLRVSWTGSQNAPWSCLLTVSVDFCPSGEHRVLAQIPYREAAERFGAWLAETAPAVAAAAVPDRLDGLPDRFRPVVADPDGEDLGLF